MGDTGDVSVSEAALEQVYALIYLRVALKKRIHATNSACLVIWKSKFHTGTAKQLFIILSE